MAEININDIEIKEDSEAKLNAVEGLPTKNVLFAPEFNAVVKAVKNARIIPVGAIQVFKVSPNENENALEPGDFVQGYIEGQFIGAHYLGGDVELLESYDMGTDEE